MMRKWMPEIDSTDVYNAIALIIVGGAFGFLILEPIVESAKRLVAGESERQEQAAPSDSTSSPWRPAAAESPADSSGLRFVGRWNASGFASAVAVDSQTVYRGDWWEVESADFTDLSSPVRRGQVPFANNSTVKDIALSGGYAYVLVNDFNANGFPPPNYFRMAVVDVSDPASPRKIGSFEARGEPHRLAVAGSHVYIANGGGYSNFHDIDDRSGLWVLDVSDPAHPRKIDACGWRFSEVAVSGERAYLIGQAAEGDPSRLHVFDTSDPTALQKEGVLPVDGRPTNVAVAGDYAYVGAREGLRVFDVSDPVAPEQTAAFGTRKPINDVAVDGAHVFVTHEAASQEAGRLRMIDASDPAALRLEGTLLLEGYDEYEGVTLKDLAVSAGRAYVATWRDGLLVAE